MNRGVLNGTSAGSLVPLRLVGVHAEALEDALGVVVLPRLRDDDFDPESRQDYSPLLTVAVETGLRKGELLGLQWGDLDLEEGVLQVRRQWTKYGELTQPKTAKAVRRVPLAPQTITLLRRLRLASRFSQEADFVFASRDGTPLGHRNIDRRGFEPARDLAGLPDSLTSHDLRHAFASRAAHRGVPLNVLSEIMGHTTVAITAKVYVHLYGRFAAEEAFRTAMAR